MESTLKRTWAEIDLDHLTHNFEVIRRRVGDKVKLLGVVKADGYGHGAVEIAKRLEQLGAGYLAVSNIDECEELRDSREHIEPLMDYRDARCRIIFSDLSLERTDSLGWRIAGAQLRAVMLR